MDFSEREREITRLREAISRSQHAISTLQQFVRQSEDKLRKVEGEATPAAQAASRRVMDIQIPRLRMFQ